MSPSQLLHFAIVWFSVVCLCAVAQIEDGNRVAIDPAALARYRMYAYGNLLKRSAEGQLGSPAKLSLFTDKRRADGRGAPDCSRARSGASAEPRSSHRRTASLVPCSAASTTGAEMAATSEIMKGERSDDL